MKKQIEKTLHENLYINKEYAFSPQNHLINLGNEICLSSENNPILVMFTSIILNPFNP